MMMPRGCECVEGALRGREQRNIIVHPPFSRRCGRCDVEIEENRPRTRGGQKTANCASTYVRALTHDRRFNKNKLDKTSQTSPSVGPRQTRMSPQQTPAIQHGTARSEAEKRWASQRSISFPSIHRSIDEVQINRSTPNSNLAAFPYLSTCRKNARPRPTPLCAPSSNPGMSARTIPFPLKPSASGSQTPEIRGRQEIEDTQPHAVHGDVAMGQAT